VERRSVLLIDNDVDFLAALDIRCQFLGMEVRQAATLLAAAAAIEDRLPDVICLDVDLPTGNGLQFCRMLHDDSRTESIPVVILTGQGKPEVHRCCHELGALHVPKTSGMWAALEPLLNRLNREGRRIDGGALPSTPKPQSARLPRPIVSETHLGPTSKAIVVVNGDQSIAQEFADRCNALGCCIYHTSNGLDGISLIRRVLPDLVCVDVSPTTSGGLGVCDVMATDERLRLTPVVLLAGPGTKIDLSERGGDCGMSITQIHNDAGTWDRLMPLIASRLQHDLSTQSKARNSEGVKSSNNEKAPDIEAGACERLVDAMFFTLGADATSDEAPAGVADKPSGPQESAPPVVLCIDDDHDFHESISMRFAPLGVHVLRAGDGMHGYRSTFTTPVRAIVLDDKMPNGRGDYILTRLKDN
jgi:CheY-like chemotaxis protein